MAQSGDSYAALMQKPFQILDKIWAICYYVFGKRYTRPVHEMGTMKEANTI
jgi:hypothetical protein